MPYENESSSLLASANFNENFKNKSKYHTDMYSLNKITDIIIKHLTNTEYTSLDYKSIKNDSFELICCSDGSILSKTEGNGCKVNLIQYGINEILLDDYLEVTQDTPYPNPYKINTILQNSNKYVESFVLPNRNITLEKNGRLLSNIETFKNVLDEVFETDLSGELKKILIEIINENRGTQIKDTTNLSDLPIIEDIIESIDTGEFQFNTHNASLEIMNISEILLTKWFQKHNDNKSLSRLIVKDGPLYNRFVGRELLEYEKKTFKNIDNICIGFQKNGSMNQILTKIHEVLKNNSLNETKIQKDYNKGKAIFMEPKRNFLKDLGLNDLNSRSFYGSYYFYITAQPERKEFVLSVPKAVFTNNTLTNKEVERLLTKLTGTIEILQTDFYLNNKGIFLPNIIAHDLVSLNNKYTEGVIEEKAKNQQNNHKKIKP